MNHEFNVTGMSCEHCERAVIRAIRTLDNQAQVVADHKACRVAVQSELSEQVLKQAVRDEGYTVAD
jgi:copper chaperone